MKLLKDICVAKSSNIALKDLSLESGEYPIYGLKFSTLFEVRWKRHKIKDF